MANDLLLKLRNLQSFDISNNRIKQLPPQLFKGNPKLIVLHISRNLVKIVPQTLFSKLELLEDLDFSNNKIERLPKFLFTDLKNLKRLQLAENRIDYLPTGKTSLVLHSKLFRVLGLFDSLPNLEYLNFRKNHISSISDKLFSSLQSLKSLQLTSNHLRRVTLLPSTMSAKFLQLCLHFRYKLKILRIYSICKSYTWVKILYQSFPKTVSKPIST